MQLTYFTVFISGLLTFLAPCILPVYPMYLSYNSGMSLSELKDTNTSDKKHLLAQSFIFVMGLSVVFFSDWI